MAGPERLAAEGDGEPPRRVLDRGLEVADGSVATHGLPAAVGKRGEPLPVDDLKSHPDGLDDDLELEIGKGKGLSLLPRREQGGAVGGGVEAATAEFIGKGIDGEGRGGEGRRRDGGVGAGEKAASGGEEDGGGGDDVGEEVVELAGTVLTQDEGFEIGGGDGARVLERRCGSREGKESKRGG